MAEQLAAITWEGPEHSYTEKSGDWYWILTIITLSVAVAVFLFGNLLLSLVILLSGAAIALLSVRRPAQVPFSVSTRGVRFGPDVFPSSTLAAYHIEEADMGAHLLLRTKRKRVSLLVIPIPVEHIDEINQLVSEKLPEEELEESIVHKFLDAIGF